MDPLEAFLKEVKENPSVDFSRSFTKSKLKDVAELLGLEIRSSMRKADIVEVVVNNLKESGVIQIAAQNSRCNSETEELPRHQNYDIRIELEKVKLEHEFQLKLAEMKMQKEIEIARMQWNHENAEKRDFDLSGQIRLVPHFNEREVETFFQNFERVAEASQWPRKKWTLLVQTALKGKAQKIYAGLSDEDAKDYEIVKAEVLKSYELVSEAYRQKFRNRRKENDRSHIEFAKEQEMMFDKWCASANASTFQALKQLILIEQFKSCVVPTTRAYLDEKSINTLDEAAKMADQYVLTHRVQNRKSTPVTFVGKSDGKRDQREASKTHQEDSWNDEAGAMKVAGRKTVGKIECWNCGKKGHRAMDCWSKKPGGENQINKPIAFLVSHEKSSLKDPMTARSEKLRSEENLLRESEKAFSYTGTIGTSEEDQTPIKIWRDSGCSQTLLKKGLIEESKKTATGLQVLISGVVGSQAVPLHDVMIKSEAISGRITVGVIDELPIPGVHLLLGNDLMGGQVFTPIVSEIPKFEHEPEELFPACAVTRAQSKRNDVDEAVSLADTFIAQSCDELEKSLEKQADVKLKIDKETLIKDQNEDAELAENQGA